jgi:23S rRNA (uracil1939-C5)-methyltransferase
MSSFPVLRLGQMGDGIVETPAGIRHVPKVLPGEQVTFDGAGFATVISLSPDRVAPFCPHYAQCGGCKFQHWRAEPYAQWKTERLLAALTGHGVVAGKLHPLVDAHGTGRRRVSLHVRRKGDDWVSGFMEQKTHDLCSITQCPVLMPQLADAPRIAAAFGPSLGDCDVALTAADNGVDVSIKAERQAVQRRLGQLSTLFTDLKLLRLSINGEVFSTRAQPVVAMGTAQVPLPVGTFLQATRAGEQALVRLVLQSLPKVKSVADLFSGLGTFTFSLAEKAKVHAIDSDKPAIAALEQGVRHTQGLKPITAEVRNLFNAPLTTQELAVFDAVILDPPRAGAEAQCRMIAKSKLRHVTYVSCDPQSFARDASLLAGAGFVLDELTPVDQFKYTAHVEMVGVFKR